MVPGEPADRFEPGDWWQLHRDQVVVITDVEPASSRLRWVTYRPVHGEGNPDVRITDRLHVDRLVARISLVERRERLLKRAKRLRVLWSQARHEYHYPRARQCAWTLRHVIEPELADL
jgi:hypothetical protein